MSIAIRKPAEIDSLRAASRIVGKTLNHLKSQIKPGITLKELDTMGEDMIRSCGATPSFKGLYGFNGSVCTSVNEVIIHGIPNEYKLQVGDIVGLDIGTQLNGWYGDAAITCGVGEISQADQRLIACSKDALYFAISQIKVGMHFKELSALIEQFILDYGYVPLRGFCGHGIGRKPHEEPEIPNYLEGKKAKQGDKIKEGMVFCIEPMICQKDGEPRTLEDDWSVVSVDGLKGSHYEHTVAIINGKAEILSLE
ncbi:type I methionyl aminopeptidase [Helicobacter rodentium]|uniref:type I methionyl aminopeptidase n=1 Tax=Helicobacter rodentium TaxID=59617 RepID=UPI00047D4EEE|nr:type I methionyl aminopeptidase [Helicobacter rodentium]